MHKRSYLVFMPLICLGACSDAIEQPQADSGAERIACAVSGAGALTEDCLVERVEEDGVIFLVVRHTDGTFRRFEQLTRGRGLELADGAGSAKQEIIDGALHVTTGGDRYVFPARVTKQRDN